jgi:hypothetical protein
LLPFLLLCGYGEANEHIFAAFVTEDPEIFICLTTVRFLGNSVSILFPVSALFILRMETSFLCVCPTSQNPFSSTDVSSELMTQKTRNEKFVGVGNVVL